LASATAVGWTGFEPAGGSGKVPRGVDTRRKYHDPARRNMPLPVGNAGTRRLLQRCVVDNASAIELMALPGIGVSRISTSLASGENGPRRRSRRGQPIRLAATGIRPDMANVASSLREIEGHERH